MSSIAFSKLLPGGNTTIILTDSSLAPGELSAVSATLMHPLHLHAEQVGALHQNGPMPHLQMMGGEFCVNATRSASLLLARAGKLHPADECLYGQITVSGMAAPVDVLVSKDEQTLADLLQRLVSGKACLPYSSGADLPSSTDVPTENAPGRTPAVHAQSPALAGETRLHCAARMDCGAGSTRLMDIAPGVRLVHLPGISHLLIDAHMHPMPAGWRQASAAWRAQSGLGNAPASGVVWYERQDGVYRIWPAVEVKATASEHLETACGSASMAMALMHQSMHRAMHRAMHAASDEAEANAEFSAPLPRSSYTHSGPEPLGIIQPSGEILSVTLQYAPGCPTARSAVPAHAWVFGRVSLLAEGITHV